jgi:hypothetical protein
MQHAADRSALSSHVISGMIDATYSLIYGGHDIYLDMIYQLHWCPACLQALQHYYYVYVNKANEYNS